MTIKVDMSEAERFAKELERFSDSAARRASARALTKTAKVAKNISRKQIKRGFTIRNRWTLGSVQSTRAAPRAIDDQFALAGSKQDYMRDQEFGQRLKMGQRVTTARGSNEGDKAFPRQKLARGAVRPSGKMNIKSVRVRGDQRGKGRKAFAQLIVARRKRIPLIYLDWGSKSRGVARGKGFFKVVMNEIDEHPKAHMVHGLLQRRTVIRRRPWLGPATEKARRLSPRIWAREIVKAVDEEGLFR